MKNLYLIRHGETELNKSKVYYGATDCSLTEEGRKQSQRLIHIFQDTPVDIIYTSPLERARETADIIFNTQIKRERDQRLAEMNFGAWEGKHYTDLRDDPLFQKWQEDWEKTRTPQGESFNDVTLRIEDFWQDLRNKPHDNIAIVGHNSPLTVLLTAIFSLPPEKSWHFRFLQGYYTKINFADDFPVLLNLNS